MTTGVERTKPTLMPQMDVNVIGSTYADVEGGEYNCVVTHCKMGEDGILAMTDDAIFCFYIEKIDKRP